MTNDMSVRSAFTPKVWRTIIVCGLGYFVDIYDLILFSIVRVDSLTAIGVTAAGMQDASELILNSQMIGMLIGGLLFGSLADKRGRLSVLLASILVYSLMNICNAFVASVPMYALFRFIAGIGLAGELGVAITLVAEIMPKHARGYGTTMVASMGILGAVAAYAVHEMFDWRAAFIIGGLMGLALLVTRVYVAESGMFKKTAASDVARGSIGMLLRNRRWAPYLSSVAIGVPIWYVIGILITFSPEFTKASGSSDVVVGGQGVMWAYVGLSAGDLVSGLVSQWLRSRRRAILVFLLLTSACIVWYLLAPQKSAAITYVMCACLGFCVGYWAVFVTTAAEQFGTNLRATVATTVPNVVRGSLVPAVLLFSSLRHTYAADAMGLQKAALVVGAVVMSLAFLGWYFLHETYGKELDYVE
ncbi:MAG: MFS transporter [Candidatus Kapabacteria bacterium]|nr:MFS transporter [Candidatus Kapabacteria bacterium]